MGNIALPRFELSAEVSSGAHPQSWNQIAKTGSFVSQRYNKFSITEQMLSEMVQNHTGDVPADYDHYSTAPLSERPSPDSGMAAGWVKELKTRNSGSQLWALTEWTPRAAEQIRNREFRFVSPTIVPKAVSTEGDEPKQLGAMLKAMAITNHPFLKGMNPLQLSAIDEDQLVVLAEVSVSERSSRLQAEYYKRFGDFDYTSYIVDEFDDAVVARRTGKLFRIPFSMSDKLDVSFGDPKEVVVNYTELSSQREIAMSGTVNNPELLQLTDRVAAQDAKIDEMKTVLATSAGQIAQLLALSTNLIKTQNETSAKSKVDGLIKAGKLPKAQEAWAEQYALTDPAGFDTFANLLTPIIALSTEHGSSETAPNNGATTTATQTANDAIDNSDASADVKKAAKIIQLFDDTIKKRVKDEKVSAADALRAVQQENPKLAEDYVWAMRQEG